MLVPNLCCNQSLAIHCTADQIVRGWGSNMDQSGVLCAHVQKRRSKQRDQLLHCPVTGCMKESDLAVML